MVIGIILGFILGFITFCILGITGCKIGSNEEILESIKFWKEFPNSMKWGNRR